LYAVLVERETTLEHILALEVVLLKYGFPLSYYVDSYYRKVSINNLELKVPSAPLPEKIQLRIIPDRESGLFEVRLCYRDKFLGSQKVINSELNLVHF
jgi:hypothetical protein